MAPPPDPRSFPGGAGELAAIRDRLQGLDLPAATVEDILRTLETGELRFRNIVEAAPLGMLLYRLDGDRLVLTGSNPASDRILGIDTSALVGATIEAAFPLLAETAIPETYRRIARDGDHWHSRRTEYRDERFEGAYEVHAFPAEPGSVVVMFQDVTERARHERALQASEERFRTIFDNSPVGIAIVDTSDLRFVQVNPRLREMLGYDEEELLQMRVGDVTAPEDLALETPQIRRVVRGELDSYTIEKRYRRKDGSYMWSRLTTALISLEEGTSPYALGIIEDISEQRRAEDERRRLDEQVQQTQKLESLGILAGGIAHDFNNLLMAILGNADLARHDLTPQAPGRSYLDDIITGAQRAADLCRQLLAYSGKGRFVVQDVDVNEILGEMTHLLDVSLSKKARLRLELAGDLPGVHADPTQLRQVILNLITNASEALEDGSGTIRLATGAVACGPDDLRQTFAGDDLPPGQYVFLEVSDTGVGMDAETLRRIFDPFYSTKFAGRGLGLAAVLGIVRSHRGGIEVTSEPGCGTRFRVLLPALARPAAPVPAAEPTVGDWRGEGLVLVADDEDTVRSLARLMLERLGFDVIVARDGREALEVYRERGAEICCVLLDLTMPHMDGETAFRELRRIDPGVRVVLSSGYHEQEVSRRFLGEGLAGFLQKPYQLETLAAELQRILV
ncbi:MAG: PAS domain S-box protein [Candidatus Krumholzibacteriia bacterium]